VNSVLLLSIKTKCFSNSEKSATLVNQFGKPIFMLKQIFLLITAIGALLPPSILAQEVIKVNTVPAFEAAVEAAQPGTTIVMANRVWKDAELLFEGKGTAQQPIKLIAERSGQVFLEGQSNLRIAGEYLRVEGLVFRNGYTPTSEVIAFRKDNRMLAHHSRLTACVIDNYSNPERHEQDSWVVLYGKNNRVDHNHFEGKGNRGVTMVVRLNSKNSIENDHVIENNYFGPRRPLGSNGGETMRIGTSHYSMENSNTIVRNNYFNDCSGETEIISSKSGQNTFTNNLFYECQGSLTLRHGDGNKVEGNIFLGNGIPETGGVRVINRKQTVRDNYGYGLTGARFRGALVVMNGIPNSPLNRYVQVSEANIKNNVFVNAEHIELGAGSDAERSAPPINSVFENNTIYSESDRDVFTIHDDISGIKFEKNTSNQAVNQKVKKGFKIKKITLTPDNNGLLMPTLKGKQIRPNLSSEIPTRENTGVPWYSKLAKRAAFGSGKMQAVKAGVNTLFDAIKNAKPGDVLELSDAQDYYLTKMPIIRFPISIKAAAATKPKLYWEKKAAFEIVNGGELSLDGILFNGENAPDGPGNSVIRTSKYSMNENYRLKITECRFENLDVNHSFDVIRVYKNTFANEIHISKSSFDDISGHVLALDKETDDIGIYNAERVTFTENHFSDIEGAALSLYRGGKDESTFGPILNIDHCSFVNVGNGKRNKLNSVIDLYGAQKIDIKNSVFEKTAKIRVHLIVGDPKVAISDLKLEQEEDLKITGDQDYYLGKIHTDSMDDKTILGNDGKPLGYKPL
jgi:poly(beta-D-mannuronate) lyase